MSLFRRKKSGKVFPVKISTMDAELEFSLDYKVTSKLESFPDKYLLFRQPGRSCSTWSAELLGSERLGTSASSIR